MQYEKQRESKKEKFCGKKEWAYEVGIQDEKVSTLALASRVSRIEEKYHQEISFRLFLYCDGFLTMIATLIYIKKLYKSFTHDILMVDLYYSKQGLYAEITITNI